MNDAFRLLQDAHAKYKEALAFAGDAELSSDKTLAVQRQGRVYAEAVTRHAEVAMAFLALVETNRDGTLKFLQKPHKVCLAPLVLLQLGFELNN
jgi:hypothetical protein